MLRFRLGDSLKHVSFAAWVAILFTILGVFLRVEHAITFDGPGRGSDYMVYVAGVRWTQEHVRAFNFDPSVPYQVRYQPPLWYALGAVVLAIFKSERAIAALSVVGWAIRQLILLRFVRELAPKAPWSQTAALALHAVLPLGILIDGKVNPECVHSTLFTAALYILWRTEGQLATRGRINMCFAGLFGLVAGLAVLTKGTSAVLMLAATVSVAWGLRTGFAGAWARLLRQAVVAGVVWLAVAGWWLGPNIANYGHPFPHAWDREIHIDRPVMSEPALYRRPLGWALPFEWKQYVAMPVIRSPDEPRPNFWAAVITGTWTDFYNRGFCRLKGEPSTAKVWGGLEGFMSQSADWTLSYRCVPVFRGLLFAGWGLTAISVTGLVVIVTQFFKSRGLRGSLVLATAIGLGTWFVFMFALVYPLDDNAVLNPRYLLPISTPLIACLGASLAASAGRRWLSIGLHVLTYAFIGVVAVLVIVERFGR